MDEILLHFKKNDPILYKLASSLHFQIPNRGKDYFKNITRSIIGQQLSVKAASTIFRRFEDLVNKEIIPKKIILLNEDKLRSAGLSYAKARYVLAFAEQVEKKAINLEMLEDMSNEEVLMTLQTIKGVGRWTAEMFLMFSLNRPDVFSHGDIGLQRAIKSLYKIENYNYKIFEEISAKWAPYRTYACYILWQSLDNNPKN
jgi:DNA-3-methyladenine glycosylase II